MSVPLRPSSRTWLRISSKLGADVGGRALVFVLLVVAARVLDVTSFGLYSYAVALGLIATQLADGGLQVTLVRRLSGEHDPDAAGEYLARALRGRAYAAVVFGAIAFGLAAYAAASVEQALALGAIAVAHVIAGHAELWLQVPRASERLELEAGAGLAGRAALVVLGLGALLAGGGLAGLALAYVAGAFIAVGVARWLALAFLRPSPGTRIAGLRATYLEALPLAVATVASLLMFRIDVLLLQWLRGPQEVATYTAAYRPFEVALLVSVAVMAGTFPGLVRNAADGRRFRTRIGRVGAVLLAAGLLVAGLGWLIGPQLLVLFFGPDYTASGPLLQVLVLALPFIYLNALLTQALVALRRTWWVAAAMICGLAVNVVANLVLIPERGANGAAIATVLAEGALWLASATLLAYAVRRVAGAGAT